MSSLYRCRARVGYRPSGSEQLIVFDERQIQELNVKLKWKPNAAFANADSSTEASVSTNALSASTCSVTISDPYLTGLAWPALFDAASLYTQSNIFSANNILLPPCGEGQDPYTDKCFKYVDSESDGTTSVSKFPFLVLSLWYDVKGTSFGSDFYFRVNGLSISHGARYPSVTIRGQEARSILFNQSLVNISLDEGLPIDKALKDLAEGQGYSVSFCSNTNSDPTKKRILPRTVRYTGVTVDEAIKKVLDSVSGNFLSMPTRDYANKISMCSRGEINQGCSVFYLGKGLYEGYEINGQPELTILALNAESGSNRNNADPYLSEAFKASTYVLGDMVPQKRKKAMEKVKKVAFPGLFEKAPKHVKNAPSTTGYVWREAKPASSNAKSAQVTNEEATKIQKDGLKLFGTAPNGTTSISFLSGVVQEAIEGSGRVLIKTKFALQICEKEGSQKCFFRPVFQESTNLSSVKVKPKDKVEISQELGSSTSDKPEFVRFYIMGHNDQLTVINPKIVWEWAFPETDIPTTQSPAVVGSGGGVVPSAPKQNLKDWKATTTNKPSKILLMAGHADFTSSGAPNEAKLNVELVKWAQRNASAYGVSDFVEFYLPSSGSIPETDPRSQYAKTSAGVSGGRQVIEIHNDQKSGNSGVIPPTGGKQIWPLDDALASQYGAFNKNWRDGLAVPKRGGTILEVGRMDDPTSRIFTSGTPAQKEALYKQLMDPTMRAIAAEKARKAGTATAPASSASSSAPSEGFIVGRVGSTGQSSGPHVHIQESTSRTLSEQQLRSLASKYVTVAGKSLTSYTQGQGFGAGRDHAGIDYPIKAGEPVSVTGTIVAAGPGVGGSDCGNGVAFKPPEGPELLICHLQDKSIPPNLAGMSVSSGGGKSKPTISGSPATQGLTMETSFKGIPRSLRIIPGRTILSFITDYDAWVEEGRPASRDPGVWIPNRFKNWFVNECEYRWREGDLRVQIEAVSAWGTQLTRVPTFTNYLKSMRDSGDAKITSNYYDYIRSLGGLNWKVDGKDSTELYCPEAQNLSEFLSQGSDSTSPTDVAASFPPGTCKIGDPAKDSIINGLMSAGLKTREALAGALANMEKESGVNFNVHNGSSPGRGCGSTPSRVLGTTGYGLVQWCGSRADDLANTYKCGRNCSLDQQLSFLKKELEGKYKSTIDKMNNSKTPEKAMEWFMREFEVPRDPEFEVGNRSPAARKYFNQIKCDKPS